MIQVQVKKTQRPVTVCACYCRCWQNEVYKRKSWLNTTPATLKTSHPHKETALWFYSHDAISDIRRNCITSAVIFYCISVEVGTILCCMCVVQFIGQLSVLLDGRFTAKLELELTLINFLADFTLTSFAGSLCSITPPHRHSGLIERNEEAVLDDATPI